MTQAITDEPDEDEGRRGRTAWLVAALLLLAVLVGVGAWFLPRLFSSPPETVAVPSLINLTDAEARTRVEQANLSVGQVTKRADPDVPKGVVISQDPDPGGYVDPGTPIDWVVSTGLAKVTVPAVVGQDLETATRLLTDAGFKVNPEKRESDEAKDRVLETDPPGGMKAPEGSEVTVYYSDGPEKVPNVVGMQQADAEKALRDAGFVPDVRDAANSTEPKGTVVEQFPDPGQTATSGQQVIIFVSTYEAPPPTETPSPTPTPSPSASP